jgi:hypothetical protein
MKQDSFNFRKVLLMDGIKGVFGELPALAKRQWQRITGGLPGPSAVGAPPAPEPFLSTPSDSPIPSQITQVVFLPREPQWAYCFWTISDADQELAQTLGALDLCLRLRDVSSNTSSSQALQEIVLTRGVREWFVPIPLSDRDYRVELGYRLPAGRWHSLAQSAAARIPGHEPTELVADRFVAFDLEAPPSPVQDPWVPPAVAPAPTAIHERLYQESLRRVWRSGSEEFQERGTEGLDRAGLNDSGIGLWASGRNESGIGLAARQRSFWLVADAELIVYGATEPSATLRIGSEVVPLNADGTFRIQVPFRDGEQLYPIEAVAADGEQKRSITLEFSRTTPEDHTNPREAATPEWF